MREYTEMVANLHDLPDAQFRVLMAIANTANTKTENRVWKSQNQLSIDAKKHPKQYERRSLIFDGGDSFTSGRTALSRYVMFMCSMSMFWLLRLQQLKRGVQCCIARQRMLRRGASRNTEFVRLLNRL